MSKTKYTKYNIVKFSTYIALLLIDLILFQLIFSRCLSCALRAKLQVMRQSKISSE